MGADKFDHTARARLLLERASDDLVLAAGAEQTTKVEQAELSLKGAHVHAMLAVADQVGRIADALGATELADRIGWCVHGSFPCSICLNEKLADTMGGHR